MTARLHSSIIGTTFAAAASCCAVTSCIGQSVAEQPPLPQEAPRASLDGTGCEITQPPSHVVKACTAVLEIQPDNAAALAQRGNAYYQMGDNAAAFRDFNTAIAIDPNNMLALSRRVSLQINSGNEAAIQADIDRIYAVGPTHARDFEARGVVRALRRDHAAALNEYSAGLKLEPTNPLLLVNRAASYMTLRNVTAAMVDYEKLAETHPNYAFGHYVRGRALTEQKRFDEAVGVLEKAIQLDPNRPQFYVERGRAHLAKKSFNLAMADFDRAIEMNPALVTAHYNRGLLHVERRDYDKAIVDLSTAVALNRRFAPAYTVRGQCFAYKNNHDRAIADYSKALELDPRQAESWYRRGVSLGAKGELDRAFADLDEAIKLAPTMAIAYAERSRARLRKNDLSLAVEDATKAIELQPSLVQAYISRASAHSKLNQFDDALADYNKVIEFVPKFADMYLRRAEVLEALGRTTSANADRARAADLSTQPPSNVASLQTFGVSRSDDTVSRAPTPTATTSVMLKAAESQIGRGEYDLAITELDKVLVVAPGSWAPYALRGLAYSGKKDYVRALADASRAIELDGTVAMGFIIRCNIQLQTKAYDRALADCNKAVEIGPPNATSYAVRGNAYLLLKSFDRAIADLDKAIAMGAKGPQATFTRGLAYLYSKRFSKATDDFRKVLETEADHRGAILGLRLLTQSLPNDASMQVNVVRNADPKCGDQCAEWIAAEGRIDGNTPERFRGVLKSTGNRKLPVFIDSMGGSLAASYEVGRMIRARNLDVYVTRTEPAQCTSAAEVCRKALAAHIKFGLPRGKLASCASACTNILASGAVRSVGHTALVGIHQAAYYAVQKDAVGMVSDRRIPESVYVGMKDFFVEMGIDANLMLRLLATPHKDMYWLTHDELQSSRLANQSRSGEELITGAESDEWMIVSPKAAQGLAKVTPETQKPK